MSSPLSADYEAHIAFSKRNNIFHRSIFASKSFRAREDWTGAAHRLASIVGGLETSKYACPAGQIKISPVARFAASKGFISVIPNAFVILPNGDQKGRSAHVRAFSLLPRSNDEPSRLLRHTHSKWRPRCSSTAICLRPVPSSRRLMRSCAFSSVPAKSSTFF